MIIVFKVDINASLMLVHWVRLNPVYGFISVLSSGRVLTNLWLGINDSKVVGCLQQ